MNITEKTDLSAVKLPTCAVQRRHMLQQLEAIGVYLGCSPGAAVKRTVTGWFDREGINYFKSERLARGVGATHSTCCRCGCIVGKYLSLCSDCADAAYLSKYLERDPVVWDGDGMLYSEAYEEFFNDAEQVYEHLCDLFELFDEEITVEMIELMRLRPCNPVYLPTVDEDDLFDLWDDGDFDLPRPVQAALDVLNYVISQQPAYGVEPAGGRIDVQAFMRDYGPSPQCDLFSNTEV